MGKRKAPKIGSVLNEIIESGILSPSEMADWFDKKYGKKLKPQAFTMALRRKGITHEKLMQMRKKALNETEIRDIMEYDKVKRYLSHAEFIGLSKFSKDSVQKSLRDLWVMMGCTNPNLWTSEEIMDALKRNFKQDEKGKWEKPYAIYNLLSSFNRIFEGILPKNWSIPLKREAGELKDYLTFMEFNEFESNRMDIPKMSKEGWHAMDCAQVNAGAREGTTLTTGILSLRWEDINYETRRCKIREKGKRGKSARLWFNVPLDLFKWLNGWEKLMKWHELQYGYKPTNEKHETGRCFPITYDDLQAQFHKTRKKCNGRIAIDIETMRPHILRMTHAQWCAKLRIPLQWICGDRSGNGWYGVGWDSPETCLKYYISLETDEMEEIDQKIEGRMIKLGLA